jgi:GTP-binding protein EngB required for normal cell division
MSEISSIIVLGETGVGKSSFCNKLCSTPKCKIGENLNSETDNVKGFYGDNEYNDIFIIDTPGLNDTNGKEKDIKNIELMKDYIKQNQRIKGIIIMLKFTDTRLTGSIKESLKVFYNLFPLNNFWDHVVFVLSHFFSTNEEQKKKRKQSLIKYYNQELNLIMNESKEQHLNFIIPQNIQIHFCELFEPNVETDNEISNIIQFFRNKEQMFKKIEERIEENKIKNSTTTGNITTIEYYTEKIRTFIDFDDTQNEIKEIIDSWNEIDIEERENEIKEIEEGENKTIEYFTYKKLIHKNRNNEETITIDKNNPIEHYIEKEEMIYLPEEIETENNGSITKEIHKLYKQKKFTDRNQNVKFGEKILIDNWNTFTEIVDSKESKTEGNVTTTTYYRKEKKTDRNNVITYTEPKIINTETQVIKEYHYHHYHDGGGGGGGCFTIF